MNINQLINDDLDVITIPAIGKFSFTADEQMRPHLGVGLTDDAVAIKAVFTFDLTDKRNVFSDGCGNIPKHLLPMHVMNYFRL